MSAHAGQRGPGLWDEVCSPKMQWWSLLALADLFVINRPHTQSTTYPQGAGMPFGVKKKDAQVAVDARATAY